MLKEFLMKKMLKAKGIPEDQIEMIITLINKNPQLFEKIANEVQEKMKQGKDQMAASMEVMTKYKSEIQAALGNK